MSLPTYTPLNSNGPNSDEVGRDFKVYTDFSSDIDLTSASESSVAKPARAFVVLAAGAGATLNLKSGQAVNRSVPADLLVGNPVDAAVFSILASGTSGVTSLLVIW